MPRGEPNAGQNFASSIVLPLLSLLLLPCSLVATVVCLLRRAGVRANEGLVQHGAAGTVMVSGGRMSKGLALARAFKRAGWTVIGVEERGWGNLCPMRFSAAVNHFYLLPSPVTNYPAYAAKLLELAQKHQVDLFIPVCGAASTVEDARAAEEMTAQTGGRCRVFIQDPETVLDLHDKDRFQNLVGKLGLPTPRGVLINSVSEAMAFLKSERLDEKTASNGYILKCIELDENRGDLTLFPLAGDDAMLSRTETHFANLKLPMSKKYPYVLQEFIPGQEWCTHASVVDGLVTAFVTCPSNDMLMTYEDWTTSEVGRAAELWTTTFLAKLAQTQTGVGTGRRLTGHFSFDLILSTKNGALYPIECNPRVHTAIILLPLERLAACYPDTTQVVPTHEILRPRKGTLPRSWIYNDIIMRLLPAAIRDKATLANIHPSLPACALTPAQSKTILPRETIGELRVDPTLVADDIAPFWVLWHLWWPTLIVWGYIQGKKWTRINVSTGRIFEC